MTMTDAIFTIMAGVLVATLLVLHEIRDELRRIADALEKSKP